MTLWNRYLLKNLCNRAALFFTVFCGIYCLIDYSLNMGMPQEKEISFLAYYIMQLFSEMPLILTLTTLLSSLTLLQHLLQSGELLAVTTSGISLKKTCLPFFLFGGLMMLLLGLSLCVLEPWHLSALNTSEDPLERRTYALPIEKGGLLLCSSQMKDQTLERVILLSDSKSIAYIEALTLEDSYTQAQGVTKFTRTNEKWELAERLEYARFPGFSHLMQDLALMMTPPKALSPWNLLKAMRQNPQNPSEYKSLFVYKLVSPLYPLYFALFPPLFWSRFRRNSPLSQMFVISICALLCYRVLTTSFFILSTVGVFPAVSLLTLPVLMAIIGAYRYAKL